MTYRRWLKKIAACASDAEQVTKSYYVKQITPANFKLLWERASEYHKRWVLWKFDAAEDDLLFKAAFPKGYKKRCAQKNCLICVSPSQLKKLYAWKNVKAALIPFLRRTGALSKPKGK